MFGEAPGNQGMYGVSGGVWGGPWLSRDVWGCQLVFREAQNN